MLRALPARARARAPSSPRAAPRRAAARGRSRLRAAARAAGVTRRRAEQPPRGRAPPGLLVEVGVVLHVAVEVEQLGARRAARAAGRSRRRGRRRGRRARRARGRSGAIAAAVGTPARPGTRRARASPPQMPQVAVTRRAGYPPPYDSPPCRGLGSPSSFPPTTRRRASSRRSTTMRERARRAGPRRGSSIVVDNASADGTADALEPLLGRRAHPGAAQRREPRQGLLRPPRDARRARRAAAALRRRLRALDGARCRRCSPLSTRAPTSSSARGSRRARGVGRRQPLRRRIVGRTFVLLCRAVLREPTQRPVLRLQAVARGGGRGGLRARRSSTAGRSTPRRWRSRARSASASARSAIEWSDREGSRLSMPRVIVPVVRELAIAARPRAPGGSRRAAPDSAEAASSAPDARGAPASALGALAFAPLAGLLLRVATQGRLLHGRRRLPRRSTRCSTSTGRARRPTRADRRTSTTSRRARAVPASRACWCPGVLNALGLNATAAYLRLEAGRGACAVGGDEGVGASGSCRGSGSSPRSRWRCSSARRSRRSSAGRAGADSTRASTSTSCRAS